MRETVARALLLAERCELLAADAQRLIPHLASEPALTKALHYLLQRARLSALQVTEAAQPKTKPPCVVTMLLNGKRYGCSKDPGHGGGHDFVLDEVPFGGSGASAVLQVSGGSAGGGGASAVLCGGGAGGRASGGTDTENGPPCTQCGSTVAACFSMRVHGDGCCGRCDHARITEPPQ